jgi:hypothetical protein
VHGNLRQAQKKRKAEQERRQGDEQSGADAPDSIGTGSSVLLWRLAYTSQTLPLPQPAAEISGSADFGEAMQIIANCGEPAAAAEEEMEEGQCHVE